MRPGSADWNATQLAGSGMNEGEPSRVQGDPAQPRDQRQAAGPPPAPRGPHKIVTQGAGWPSEARWTRI